MLIEYRWLFQLLLSLLTVLGFIFLLKLGSSFIRQWAADHKKHQNRVEQIIWLLKIMLAVFLTLVISMIWGVDYRGLWVVTTSVLAVLGVALFAQWSILSNLTSGVIVFFNFPARVGDKIEIIDGVNSVKGELIEIGLFQIHLRDQDGNTLVFPNNLLLQKPVKKIRSFKTAKQVIETKSWRNRSHRHEN
ncbi:mechanosensitive ion channel [Thiomicrospira microaerophila]|uniref:mechanosensitive ion channel family protein n=1 Tax=Thiomicrospira microaerophila TaxID=406020 RepID=UPI00200FE477|nr:mechanosensitive ion channel domain-containing protein [Thiomicrospira microaerophila]UQB42835.1 mechanosensitive ion channel [Thiomicrospira microaerophila]